jgi:hypothetical protein
MIIEFINAYLSFLLENVPWASTHRLLANETRQTLQGKV